MDISSLVLAKSQPQLEGPTEWAFFSPLMPQERGTGWLNKNAQTYINDLGARVMAVTLSLDSSDNKEQWKS